MEIVIPVDELTPGWQELLADELQLRGVTLVQSWVDEAARGYQIRLRYAGEVLSPNDVLELQLTMLGEHSEQTFWPVQAEAPAELLDEEPTELDPESPRSRIPA